MTGGVEGRKRRRGAKASPRPGGVIPGGGVGGVGVGGGGQAGGGFAAGGADVPAVVSGSVIGSGILGLNYTHAAAKKIGPKQARVMHRVFCGVTGLGMAMHIFAVKQPKE